MEKLLSPADVADLLQVSRQTALALMDRMKHVDLSCGTARRNLRVYESDFQAWLKSREITPPPPAKRGRKPTEKQPVLRAEPRHNQNTRAKERTEQ